MRDSANLFILLAVMSVLLNGCGQQSLQKEQNEPVSVHPTLKADCIAHYFKSNDAAYITRQEHSYNPRADFFQISAMEPTEKIQFTLNRDVFDSTGQKHAALSDLPKSFWNKNLATLVFYSFCAGGNLLDPTAMEKDKKVKIEGQWYVGLKPAWPTDVQSTLFQSVDTNRIELVRLDDLKGGLAWLARSYNYRYSMELASRIPRTIDIYNIQDGIASKELMIRFDYKNLQKLAKSDVMN